MFPNILLWFFHLPLFIMHTYHGHVNSNHVLLMTAIIQGPKTSVGDVQSSFPLPSVCISPSRNFGHSSNTNHTLLCRLRRTPMELKLRTFVSQTPPVSMTILSLTIAFMILASHHSTKIANNVVKGTAPEDWHIGFTQKSTGWKGGIFSGEIFSPSGPRCTSLGGRRWQKRDLHKSQSTSRQLQGLGSKTKLKVSAPGNMKACNIVVVFHLPSSPSKTCQKEKINCACRSVAIKRHPEMTWNQETETIHFPKGESGKMFVGMHLAQSCSSVTSQHSHQREEEHHWLQQTCNKIL